jgi:hypothetical protein
MRLWTKRLAVAVTGAVCVTVIAPVAATADAAQPVFSAMNTSETPPDGVWFRNTPKISDTDRVSGHGVYRNERVQLECYAWGEAVGQYSNRLWYRVVNVSRPTNAGVPNKGFLNAHYINDGLNANQIDAGVPACDDASTPSQQAPYETPCVFDMKWAKLNLTFSYSGNHRYYGNAWQAAKNWTDLGTGITIRPAPAGQTGDIVFTDTYWTAERDSHGRTKYAYARTGVPDAWQQYVHPAIPANLHNPSRITIEVNQYRMDISPTGKSDRLDFTRTYALTHELGHALGLGHTDYCVSKTSIMNSGAKTDLATIGYNTPRYYDKIEVEELYGLRRG